MPSDIEETPRSAERSNIDESDVQAEPLVKTETEDTPARPEFSLDFQKFASLDEACQCLEIIRDLACLESRVQKVLPNEAVKKTLDTTLTKADRNALGRALSMSPRVLRIMKLVHTPSDRDAVREALRYLKGLSRLELEMAGLPEGERNELMRAHEWFSNAYKEDGNAS